LHRALRNEAFLIDKLEPLLALAKERHFGRAAEVGGVTQPTMSTRAKWRLASLET
jgi:regulatory helix-turn-helix LysR family protein